MLTHYSMMGDLAKEAFSTNNFHLAADIYERTIKENGPTSELFLGLADSFARGGQFSKAFESYTNAYRYGKVTPEKLKHLVVGLIDTVTQDISSTGCQQVKKSSMFTCGLCHGLLADPVTLPCGHTFCRNCLEKDQSKTCEVCSIVHYRLKMRSLRSNVVMTNLTEKWFPNDCKASRLKREGNDFFVKGDFKNAINVYGEAIELASTDHLLLSNRSHAYASLDKFEEALADAEQVVQLRPIWPKGYFRKGCALYGLKCYEDAVVAFLQCLALDQKVTSAKDYLSKALDKILSALPPDDPKAYALEQQSNPTLLQQLIEGNFRRPLLLPNINNALTNLARIVKSTIDVASNFSQEPTPQTVVTRLGEENGNAARKSEHEQQLGEESVQDVDALLLRKTRWNSLSDCSDVDHSEIQKSTIPRSHSPLPPSPVSRKRMRNPSSAQCPVSPTHSSPQKVLRPTTLDTTTLSSTKTAVKFATASPPVGITAEKNEINPEKITIDDLECGLCYRLFFEPVTTPCGHTFCRKCLDRCLDHTVTCPMCKGNLAEYLAERRQAVTDSIQCIIETYFKEEYVERCRTNDEEMVELTKMGSGQQSDIPVFVCTLAFPTIPCPLHIFEPCYRLMIRQCMESGTRQFGMCMHVNDAEEFSDYGCMLEIRDVQYFPDGRSVVDTIGGRRFKVASRGKRDGYNTAKVEFISDKPVSEEESQVVDSLLTEIHAMVKSWLTRLPNIPRTRIIQHFGDLPNIDANPTSSPNGPNWVWWAVAVLPLDPRCQMAMLAMSSLRERLIALKKVLLYMNRRGSR